MAAAELQNLTPRHDAILAYVMANPSVKRGEVARIFGVTESWLSTIIHSDLFQAKLKDRTDEVFSECLVPLVDKVNGLAHSALDNLAESLLVDKSVGVNFKTAEMALKMAGFGTQGPGHSTPVVQQNNFFTVSSERLRAARERLGADRPAPLPLEGLVIEG